MLKVLTFFKLNSTYLWEKINKNKCRNLNEWKWWLKYNVLKIDDYEWLSGEWIVLWFCHLIALIQSISRAATPGWLSGR